MLSNCCFIHNKDRHLCKKTFPFLHLLLLFFLLPFIPDSTLAGVPLKVQVSGLQPPLRTNVLHFLDMEKNKDAEDLNPRWIQRLHEQAPQEIREALQPFGYYRPDIQSELTETEGKWLAHYTIDAGEPVQISKRDIQWIGEGGSTPVFQQSIHEYMAADEDRLVHARYETAKSKFLDLALSEGYPRAKIIKSEILVDIDNNSAEVTLLMDTGPLYYFGDVFFKQNFLPPDLLQKFITLKKGEPYSHNSLIEFQQNLIGLNYAREVTLTPLFNQAQDRQLPLEVVMEPIAPHKLSFGLGYETDINIRGSARWEDRLVNRHGHQSDVYLELSQKEGSLQGQYSIPVHRALTDRWISTAGYAYEKTPDTDSNSLQLETAFVRRNLEDTNFYKGFFLASYERFTVGSDPGINTNLSTLGGIIRFSNMEESMYPQSGYSFFSDLRGASAAFFSDTSFIRMHLKGRYLLGFGENGRLESRLETGAAWVEDFEVYPTSMRFFAGGDHSVRGYDYESLGPRNKEGVVEGGKQVFSTSIEYDHRVAKSWVLDIFVDGGNAYNEEIKKIHVGSGFGFRWLAPFGSLRVDLAWPVSEDPQFNDCRIHLGFGATL